MIVKIYGAGSIGNHLANACRQKNWQVDIVDSDPEALDRMRHSVYPGRYGSWDENINTFILGSEPNNGHDLIFIGTPPDTHIDLAIKAIAERPRAILVEKPLSQPNCSKMQEFKALALGKNTPRIFVGYDHVVGYAMKKFEEIVLGNDFGNILTIDAEFREHWEGIFKAHPWLNGPQDSYLGHTKRGGGALCEHSHALNLWQHLARVTGCGEVVSVKADFDWVTDANFGNVYDRAAYLNLTTESGIVGRCVQDVFSVAGQKQVKVHFENASLSWICGFEPNVDAVLLSRKGAEPEIFKFKKSRPEDFILELEHIESVMNTGTTSPIGIEFGLKTIDVIEMTKVMGMN